MARKKITNIRYFNGKMYKYNYSSKHKSDAQSQAKLLRKKGYKARVVSGGRGFGWVVFSNI